MDKKIEEGVVVQAIQALYGHSTPQVRKEANDFLINFSKLHDAWLICLGLIEKQGITPEVHYFVANLIYSKSRHDWKPLNDEMKQYIESTLYRLVSSSAESAWLNSLVLNRICLSLSSISFHKNSISQLIQFTFWLARSGHRKSIATSLEFLNTIPDELDLADISFSCREFIKDEIRKERKNIFDLFEAILASNLSHDKTMRHLLLKALAPWIHLFGSSISFIYTERIGILTILLELVKNSSLDAEIASEILQNLLLVQEYPRPSARKEALLLVASAIMSTRDLFSKSIEEDDESVCHALTRLLATFLEVESDGIAKGSIECQSLIELAFIYLRHPKRQIGSQLLDFFLQIQDIPTAERLPALRQPLFIELLHILIDQSKYPHNFISWDDNSNGLDEDDFNDFRCGSQSIDDVYNTIYSLLRSDFFSVIITKMTTNPCWNTSESCLNALIVVSENVNDDLKIMEKDEKDVYIQAMKNIFQGLSMQPIFHSHAYIVRTTSLVFGEYISIILSWIFPNDESPILSMMEFLINAINTKHCKSAACKSIRQLCIFSGKMAAKSNVLARIVMSLEMSISTDLLIEDRLAVVEGVVRASNLLMSNDRISLIEQLISPCLHRLSSYIRRNTTLRDAESAIVSGDLKSLSIVLQYIEARRNIEDHDPEATINLILPALKPCVSAFHRNEKVMKSLFEVYTCSIKTSEKRMTQELPDLANIIVAAYQESKFPSALEAATIAVDTFGKNGDDALIDSFRSLLSALSTTTFHFFQQNSPSDFPDLIMAFYEMTYRFALVSPKSFFLSSDFPVILELSIACIGNQHRESTRSVLFFLSFLISKRDSKLYEFRNQINNAMYKYGEALMRADIIALTSTGPSTLFHHLTDLLYNLLACYGESLHPLLHKCLLDPACGAGDRSPKEKDAIMRLFIELAEKGERQRFKMFGNDFAKICRNQLSFDSLFDHSLDDVTHSLDDVTGGVIQRKEEIGQ